MADVESDKLMVANRSAVKINSYIDFKPYKKNIQAIWTLYEQIHN